MKIVLVFSIIWIVLMFLALPIGIKVPKKTEIGFADSAPSQHYLGRKFFWTILISVALTSIYWYLMLRS